MNHARVIGAAGLTAFVAMSGGIAQAAPVAYDGFEDYATGGLNDSNGGAGWLDAWSAQSTANVVAGGLSYGNGAIQIDGGGRAVSVTGSHDALLHRPFTTIAEDDTDQIYFSFLFQQVSGAGSDFLDFWVSNNDNRNNSGSIGDHSTTAAAFGARLRSVSDTTALSSVGYAAGEIHLLVGRLSRDGSSGDSAHALRFDQMELWVNPTSLTLGTPDATADASTGLNGGFSFFGLRTVNVGSGDEYLFDELRVGTDAASVLVPEPGTVALTASGAMLLGWRQRRRS